MAEGGGLLNRCTVSSRTVSSNLIPSAMGRFSARSALSQALKNRRNPRISLRMAPRRCVAIRGQVVGDGGRCGSAECSG